MSTLIPDEGLDWISDYTVPGVPAPELQYVAIGTGTPNTESDDTSLESSEYRASIDGGNASIESTSSTGEIRASITVSGGTEVEADSDLTELGILTEEYDLVYREVRNAVTVEQGERVTFEFTLSFVNQ